MDNVIIFY